MVHPVEAHIESAALTFADLEASAGKGPRLGPDDIADTYCSDEEFLAALDAPRSRPHSTLAS